LAALLGNDRDVDHPQLVCIAIQQEPACGLPAKFNDEMLGARKSLSVVAGLRLVLQAQQCLALRLRQKCKFGVTGAAEKREQEVSVISVRRAEMDQAGSPLFFAAILAQAPH